MTTQPEAIDGALARREMLILEVKRLDTELSNKDKRMSSGRRMDGFAWHKWRQSVIEEKAQIEIELRELKSWIGKERKRLALGRSGGNPRDALYFSIRSADRIISILQSGEDDGLDPTEKELMIAIQNYLSMHAVLGDRTSED